MLFKLNTENYSYTFQGIEDLMSFNTNFVHVSEKFLISVDGVFTHRLKTNEQDFHSNCLKILDSSLNDLTKYFDGVYRVVVYDIESKRLRCFTSLDGQLPLFSYKTNNYILIGTSIKEISEFLTIDKKRLSLSIDGAYMLLGHGFMLEDHTLFQEVKRVPVHKCLDFSQNKFTLTQHTSFCYDELQDKEDILLEEFNRLFINAIHKQFSFDVLNSKKHLVALSGGLDSRMVTWVSNHLGYTNQVNYTFAQVGSGDEIIPKQIAAYLGHDWIFNFLDNGNYLLNFEKSIKQTEGNSVFAGMAHALNLYQKLNFNQFGVVHSGQLGDVILAWSTDKYSEPSIELGAYNKTFIGKLSPNVINMSEYQNDMDFKYLNRYINGTNYGLRSTGQWTCSFSPFLDKDVWQFLTQVPLKFKLNHKFYVKWMNTYYPESTNFVYDAWNLKPNTTNPLVEGKINFQGRAESFGDIASKIARAAKRNLGLKHKPSTKAMNPYKAWWLLNPKLSTEFAKLFDAHIGLLDEYIVLKQDVTKFYQEGDFSQKLQALDLLLALDYIHNFK